MATHSFKDALAKAETTEEQTVVTQTPAIMENKALAVPLEETDMEGEIVRSDIRLPRVNIVQKVGDLSNLFTPGSILFNKEVVLTAGKTPVEVVPLRLKKVYQQDLPYGSEETALVFEKAEDVRLSGGSLQWGDDNYYTEVAHVQVAIIKPDECPEELEPLFPFEHDGKMYGCAMWTLKGSAFTSAGRTLITARTTLLREGLHTGRFMLSTELKKNTKNSWYAPILKFAGRNSAEASSFFAGLK
jgi:hypothetical protein